MGEWFVVLIAIPYRCRRCDHRELVFRLAGGQPEGEGEPALVSGPVAAANPVAPQADHRP